MSRWVPILMRRVRTSSGWRWECVEDHGFIPLAEWLAAQEAE